MTSRVVVESPLGADTAAGRRENLRFALWCLRACELADLDAIASHVVKPWFLDDQVPAERAQGIASEWFWLPDVPHLFFMDLGCSAGMEAASRRCRREGIPLSTVTLATFDPECWAAFKGGEWPPHTGGFELGPSLVEQQRGEPVRGRCILDAAGNSHYVSDSPPEPAEQEPASEPAEQPHHVGWWENGKWHDAEPPGEAPRGSEGAGEEPPSSGRCGPTGSPEKSPVVIFNDAGEGEG